MVSLLFHGESGLVFILHRVSLATSACSFFKCRPSGTILLPLAASERPSTGAMV